MEFVRWHRGIPLGQKIETVEKRLVSISGVASVGRAGVGFFGKSIGVCDEALQPLERKLIEVIEEYDRIATGMMLPITGIISSLTASADIQVKFEGLEAPVTFRHNLSPHQIEVLAMGGAINWRRKRS
jgi:hypothetical protein